MEKSQARIVPEHVLDVEAVIGLLPVLGHCGNERCGHSQALGNLARDHRRGRQGVIDV
jgi:hypothetical protein